MKGWKIQPLGWLFLAVLAGLVIYYVFNKRFRRPPQDQEGQTESGPDKRLDGP